MADKKQTHESMQQAIVDAELAVQKAKDDYKAFCKENPYTLPKQPTIQELRKLRAKTTKDTAEDYAKAQKAAAESAKKQQLKQEIKGI